MNQLAAASTVSVRPLPRMVLATDACPERCGRLDVANSPDRVFDDVVDGFRMNGGLLDGDALAGVLRDRIAQPVSCIARMIVARRIVSLARGGRTLVPLFQFRDASLALRPEVATVISEFVDVLDDVELARWFATGNAWLAGASPVATISADPDAVQAAARADRFVVRGV